MATIFQILNTRGEVEGSAELREKLKSSLKTLTQYIINFNTSVEFIFRKLLMNKICYNIRARKCQEVRKTQILSVAVMIHTCWKWEGFREFAAFSRQWSYDIYFLLVILST